MNVHCSGGFNFNIMKKVQIVCGTQWGDEGKGKTVQYLCQKAIDEGSKPLVVRFCSGPQASHTVVHEGTTHVCSSFGSGVLLNVPTLIYAETTALIDPIALHAEYDLLVAKGVKPEFYIDCACYVITPYDVIANRKDKEALENGTCGCGIWECVKRNEIDEEFLTCGSSTRVDLKDALKTIRTYYRESEQSELEEQFIKDCEWLKDHVVYWDDCKELAKKFDTIIYESSQGLLLDGTRGLHPFITPCEVLPERWPYNKFYIGILHDIPSETEVYLCTRTYATRHGGGYDPEPFSMFFNTIKLPELETNKDNEYQGQFKTGVLNIDMINRAIDRHCLDNLSDIKFHLVINHVDCVQDYFEFIYKGKRLLVTKDKMLSAFLNIRLPFTDILWSDTPESRFNTKSDLDFR